MKVWGKLIRNGGTETDSAIPSQIELSDSACFFGRFPEPVKSPDSKFVHVKQTVIPCLFISSTHCSIRLDRATGRCYMNDYSRNGTYVDGVVLTATETAGREVKDGSEVSFKYKNVIRLSYRLCIESTLESGHFDSEAPTLQVPVSSTTGSSFHMGVASQSLDPSLASRKRQAEESHDILSKQLSLLQEQERLLDERLRHKEQQLDSVSGELEASNRYSLSLETSMAAKDKLCAELKADMMSLQANLSAIEARNSNIQQEYDECKRELKELKAKNSSILTEAQHKASQLDVWRSLVEESTKAYALEKSNRVDTEEACARLRHRLRELTEQLENMKTANQVLQDMVSDLESLNANLKVSFYEKQMREHELFNDFCVLRVLSAAKK
jgi:hypothetical protein